VLERRRKTESSEEDDQECEHLTLLFVVLVLDVNIVRIDGLLQ